jgi:hypothetical protein
MEWRVEYVLRPGSAMLEQNVWLYNRGDIRQPYYVWTNAEETIQDLNDRFFYPAYVMATHGFTVLDTWPVNRAAVDMSVIKNYTDQTALFAYGSSEPFLAAYHPTTKIGTVHYADAAVMPGKKLWAWGPAGDVSVKNSLTENFPSYIETRAGVSISYAIAANSTTASRSETLLIAGQPFTITQAGAACSLSLTNSSASVDESGGTFYVGVVSPSDSCTWSAATNQDWISLTSGANGNGGGVSLTVAPNTGDPRMGIVTIARQPFTVTQSGASTSLRRIFRN